MAPASSNLVELARRIVEQEAGESPDPPAFAAPVDTACRKLRDELIDLLGSGGVSALLGRALHLAQREQPLLTGVTVSGEPARCFIGLAESLAENTDEGVTAAAATPVLTHMLDLLITLMGEELGMKPIRKIWPQATRVREIDE